MEIGDGDACCRFQYIYIGLHVTKISLTAPIHFPIRAFYIAIFLHVIINSLNLYSVSRLFSLYYLSNVIVGLIDQFTLFSFNISLSAGPMFPFHIISYYYISSYYFLLSFLRFCLSFFFFLSFSVYISMFQYLPGCNFCCHHILSPIAFFDLSSFSCFHNSIFFFLPVSGYRFYPSISSPLCTCPFVNIFFPSSSSSFFVFYPFSFFLSVLLILLILNFILFFFYVLYSTKELPLVV